MTVIMVIDTLGSFHILQLITFLSLCWGSPNNPNNPDDPGEWLPLRLPLIPRC